MKMSRDFFAGVFLRWWLFFCLLILAAGVAGMFGAFELLLEKDSTFISFGILGIFIVTSLWIGRCLYRSEFDQVNTDTAKFIANKLVKLGLIGTVIGFIMMLDKMSGDFNFSSADDAAPLLGGMAAGMTAALFTTLTGLVCSGLLKVQIRYLDIIQDRRDNPKKRTKK